MWPAPDVVSPPRRQAGPPVASAQAPPHLWATPPSRTGPPAVAPAATAGRMGGGSHRGAAGNCQQVLRLPLPALGVSVVGPPSERVGGTEPPSEYRQPRAGSHGLLRREWCFQPRRRPQRPFHSGPRQPVAPCWGVRPVGEAHFCLTVPLTAAKVEGWGPQENPRPERKGGGCWNEKMRTGPRLRDGVWHGRRKKH